MEVPLKTALSLLVPVLLFCVSSSFAESKCVNCRGAGGPFLPGNVYTYELEGLTITKLPGSSDDVSSLGISATAEVFAESGCQHVLKLSNVEVKTADGKKYNGLNEDCAKPVKFSYIDGKLEGICAEEGDRGAGLNIKRAVISLLSSAKKLDSGVESGYENDVFGICPTEFSFSKDGPKLTVQKTRNLNRCALREDLNFPFPTSPYQAVQSSFGAFESLPLFGGELKVVQEIENGVLHKASGEEHYTYSPFVNHESKVTIEVSYKLSLKGSSPGSIPANVNSFKAVYYEPAHDDDGVNNHDKILGALQKATAALDPEAKPEAAKEFAHLVDIIEQGSKSDILQAYNAAQGKTAKNLFLDGLFYAGSADSVEAAAELLKSEQIPKESADRWYLDLNFVKHASRGALTSLLPLLSGDNVPHQAYLGIGSLAGKFCLEHQQLCHTSPEFKDLVSKLAAPLDGGCKVASHEKENNVIASLKGLRNTRHLPDEVAQKISQCATDKSAKTRVRAAAIEAFFADASNPKIEQAATSILKDVEEDSELRIKAYLALVEHPCPKAADTVKELIESEPINQVGSFVVSHLRNLRASVSPEKEAAKKMFGNIISKKKFPIDQRKFSRNYEVSYSLDALNVGAVGEVNRIFSQKAFLPRSVSLNLTTQLFGHSVNLAEVGVRAENIERILEKYFGPKGVFKTKGPKFFDDVADQAEEALKKAKEQAEAARPKRSISKQQAEEAAKKIKLGPDYENLDTDIDLSLKLFGSDVAWYNYHHSNLDYKGLKNKLDSKLDESLDKTKSIDVDYKKARRFLDVGITYPTGLGFGLKAKVIGNSAVNIKLKGQIDLKAIMNNPKNAHIALQVVPSASVELKSLFIVDAHVVESGLKVTGNLHSSTGSDLTVKVLDGYGVDVKLGLPVKKQEIINFHSDVVSIVKEKKSVEVESPIKFSIKRQERGGCFDQLSSLLGLTICGEVSIPVDGLKFISAAYGPSKASLRFEKDDESLTAYHFKAFYNNKEPDQFSVEVLLDTPNSRTNRKFNLHLQASRKPQKQLVITLVSPFKQASFEALVIDTETEQALSAKLLSDGSEYSFKAGAHVSQEGNRKKYEPLLEYKYPESTKSDRAWIGRKGTKGGKQAQQTAVGITGAVYVEKNPGTQYRKYELKSVTLTTPKEKVIVDGTITIDENLLSTDLKASYDKETFTFVSTIQKLAEHKYIAKVEFLPSQHPDIGGSIKWEYDRTPDQIENKLVVIHGSDLKSESARISITQLVKYKYESVKMFEFHTENTVSYPLLAISAIIKGGATPKSLDYNIDISYDKTQVSSKLDAKVGAKHPTDYSIDFEGKALGNSVSLSSKHERVTSTKSKFTNSLEMKPGGRYSLNGLVEVSSKQGEMFKSLSAEMKMPQDPKNVKLKAEVKQNSKEEELEFEVIAGNKQLVDIDFELSKTPEPTGKFKVLLHKVVDSEGSFKTVGDNKASGSFWITILKTGRKIEGSGEFSKTSNHIKGFGELLLDAKKDPTKKIHIETDTHIEGKSIDTKNKLQVYSKTSEVNVKGNLDGTLSDGTLVGEAEVVFPCGRVVTGKVNRVFHLSPADKHIEGTWEVCDYESRGAQPRKWALKLAGKNINPAKIQFDGQADFTFVSTSKSDIVVHLAGKKVPKGDSWAVAGEGSLSGSLVKYPLSTKLDAEVSEQFLKGQLTSDKKLPPAHYIFELKTGNNIAILSSGKLSLDQFTNEVELKFPEAAKENAADWSITSLKWHTSNTISLFTSDDSEFKVLSSNALHWNGDKFVKLSSDIYKQNHQTHGKLVWESHVLSPRTLKYKLYNDVKNEKGEIDLDLQWEGKTADLHIKVDGYSGNPIKVKISSNVPENGKYDVDIFGQVAKDGKSGETSISGTANNQKFSYSGKYGVSDTSRHVDLNIETPQGKSSLYSKVVKKGENHVQVETKYHSKPLNLDMNGEVKVHSLDDLYVKLYFDSPELKLNKVDFEAKSEQTKSAARKIIFHGKGNDKDISGSLVLSSKAVLPNIHYEGSGAIKVGEETYPIQLTLKANKNEQPKGYHYDILGDLKFGKHSGNVKLALSDDGTVIKYERSDKYCYENDCKNDEYKIKYERKGPLGVDYDITVDVNLGLSPSHVKLLNHPLAIKGQYNKEGWKYNDNTEITYGPKKLQYKEYLNEDHAGFELTLPKRIIAGEVVGHIRKSPAVFKIEANFWLDKKNAADKKTSLVISTEANKQAQGSSLTAEARFNTPGVKELSVKSDINVNVKDHVINSKLEADVFAKKAQKLVVEYKAVGKKENQGYTATSTLHISSKGLDIEAKVEGKLVMVQKTSFGYSITGYYLDSAKSKREAVAKVYVDSKSFNALVKIPEGTLYSADVSIEKGNKDIRAKGTYELLGLKFEEHIEVKGSHAKVSIIQKKDGNPQLDWDFGFTPGQVAEISAKFNKAPLVSLEVALDEAHFLKSKHSYNTDAAKQLIKLCKENSIALTKEASRVVKESGAKIAHEVNDKLEDCRKGLVSFKPAVQYYQKELEELKEEITSNKEVQDIIDFFNNTFGTILKQIGVIVSQITETTERLIEISNEALKKVTESVKTVIPKLKKQYEEGIAIVIQQAEAVLDFATNIIGDILDKIKEHEKDIQELTSVFTDFLHDVGQTFAKVLGEVQKEIKDFLNVLWDQIQALPAYSMLQEKYQELKNYKIPEDFWETYHQSVSTIEELLPTPELQKLVKYLSEIFEKAVKNEPINKPEVLERLYNELVAAIRSVLAIIEAHKPDHSPNAPSDVTLPVPSFAMFVAPPGTFRFSLFNWIRSPDLPTLSEIINTYRPQHSPLDVIPPFKASALLLGGTEFFTFDKKHYSFKGSCSYILAKDVIDGNFTIVANMEAGKLKSIAVFDHENSIELQHDNKVLVNGQPSELPARAGELHMWRKYNDGTGFATHAGLMFFCTPHLRSCAFSINGFYFGKTRGLFGTYNNEPYDDVIVPEGKAAKSTAEFTNSWKISSECPDGAVHEQPAPPAEECTKLFSGDSSLRNCFQIQNPDNFRDACNKQVAEASGEDRLERACNIALSYSGYCYYVHFTKVNIPDYCGKCNVGSQPLKIGESVAVKSPQKEADVVFVVQQSEENEDVFKNLITPLVSTLTNDLKEHGVTDVKFALIGYGAPDQYWPAVYTFNGEFNGFTGAANNIHFHKEENVTEPKLSDRIKEVVKRLEIETGQSKIANAYKEAFDYPFRPEAAKTIVGLVSSGTCSAALLPFQTIRLIVNKLNVLSSGISMNLITNLEDLELEGKDEKTAANVVGFDSYTVYTQSEAKRKVLKGDEEAFKHLKYTSNHCIDFALGANGAVFSSSNFVNGKPNLRKNFLQVLSNKITESLTSVEVNQECKCELDRGMVTRTKCKIVSRKEKESLSVKGGVKGGVKA